MRDGGARAGGLDRHEVAAIYERYGAAILRRCRSIMRTESAADDALQEVFVNLIRYGARYRDAEAKLPWLFRVTDRCCFALLDRNARAPGPVPEVMDTPGPDSSPESRLVLDALSRLQAEERALAVLAFVEERDQGEIGKLMGYSRQTINRRLKSLRSRAAALLEAEP